VNEYFRDELYLSSFEANGRTFTFLLNSRHDHIQQFLASGHFYEEEELELICAHAIGCTRLLDIGANIGNHSIFLAHRLNLIRAIPIEPQPAVIQLLRANLGLNWHPSFDLSYIGLALSDKPGMGRIDFAGEDNIGGTKIIAIPENDCVKSRSGIELVRMCSGDDLFQPGAFDIIKLDVEGLEIKVLMGLRRLLQTFSGVIFAEALDTNLAEFQRVMSEMGFSQVDQYRRYEKCSNLIFKR